MPQTEESGSPPSQHRWAAPRIILDVLGESTAESAYRRQLFRVLERWGEPVSDVPAVSRLPGLTCAASGGDPGLAAPVTAVWQLVRLAAKLLDDVEDGTVRDRPALIVNAATGLLSVVQLALGVLSVQLPSGRAHRLCQAFHRAMLRACAGQHADLVAGQCGLAALDPDTWLEVAGAKSGEPLAWAAWAGALVAGADERALAGYRAYGYYLGVLLQAADDFNGVWHPAGAGDLAAGRPTLPVCYALSVTRGEARDRLEMLLRQAVQGDDTAEAKARQRLIDLGAQSYLLVVARVRQQQALAALQRAEPAPPADRQLVALLDRVMPALSQLANGATSGPTNEFAGFSRFLLGGLSLRLIQNQMPIRTGAM
jgi:geranylgeranyl pyrophosphate synthase